MVVAWHGPEHHQTVRFEELGEAGERAVQGGVGELELREDHEDAVKGGGWLVAKHVGNGEGALHP